jgi:DHA1 family multidrug/chloramphenicol efflux transport protein-like MFS transporter
MKPTLHVNPEANSKIAIYIVFFISLFQFLVFIASDAIMPGMLVITKTFHVSDSYVSSALSFYLYGGSSLLLILGPLAERFGYRPLLLIGVAMFAAASFLIAMTNSIQQFLVLRFIEGMGLCFIYTVGYAAVQDMFVEQQAVRMTTIMNSLGILSALGGPIIGAWALTWISWRMLFVVIASTTLLCLLSLWYWMPQQKHNVELVLTQVYRNYKQLCLEKVFLLGAIAYSFAGILWLTWIGLAPIILMKVNHVSMGAYSLWQIPIFLSCIIGNVMVFKLCRYYSLKLMFTTGGLILCLGYIVLCIGGLIDRTHFESILPGLIIYFLGIGLLDSPYNRFILFSTTVGTATASALLMTIYRIITATAIMVGQILYDYYLNRGLAVFIIITGIIFISVFYKNWALDKKTAIEYESVSVTEHARPGQSPNIPGT